MVYASENLDLSTLSNRKTVIALEVTLNQSLCNLKDLVLEFEQLQMEVTAQKEKCERKACVGSEALKKVIEIKDNIIQSVASALTTLNETKDMNIIHEAFKILCGETVSLTPPAEKLDKKLTPKKEPFSEITDGLNDESVSEIDGTPTGRTSPIILSKKYRNTTASDLREKKKCPDNWPISENKTVKLSFPTPIRGKTGSKLRQARFTFVKQKSVVDLTSSLEFSGSKGFKEEVNCLQLDIKKEPLDDEDTIQPSPTSITSHFPGLYGSAIINTPLKKTIKNSPNKITKNSPNKFVKKQLQLSKLQIKTENTSKCNVANADCKVSDENLVNMEESINLLRPINRFQTPTKRPLQSIDPEETDCEIDSSLSLLKPIKSSKSRHDRVSPENKAVPHSHIKAPLSENINCTNLQTQCDTVSMSILEQNPNDTVCNDQELAPNLKENRMVEPVSKEPTVRKKAEKRALPGWSCDECKNFYAELYKDNPEMLAKKMDECSKHRGKNNPVRPKTPPGFWNPRWDVPENTEEFNRRNNAV